MGRRGLVTLWFCWTRWPGTVILFIANRACACCWRPRLLGAFITAARAWHWQHNASRYCVLYCLLLCWAVSPGLLGLRLRGSRRWLLTSGLRPVGVWWSPMLGFLGHFPVYTTGVQWTGPDARWTLLRFGVGALGCPGLLRPVAAWLFSRIPARLAQAWRAWGRPACACAANPALQRHDLGRPRTDAGPGRCAQSGRWLWRWPSASWCCAPWQTRVWRSPPRWPGPAVGTEGPERGRQRSGAPQGALKEPSL